MFPVAFNPDWSPYFNSYDAEPWPFLNSALKAPLRKVLHSRSFCNWQIWILRNKSSTTSPTCSQKTPSKYLFLPNSLCSHTSLSHFDWGARHVCFSNFSWLCWTSCEYNICLHVLDSRVMCLLPTCKLLLHVILSRYDTLQPYKWQQSFIYAPVSLDIKSRLLVPTAVRLSGTYYTILTHCFTAD